MSSVILNVWIDLNANAVFAFFNQAPLWERPKLSHRTHLPSIKLPLGLFMMVSLCRTKCQYLCREERKSDG